MDIVAGPRASCTARWMPSHTRPTSGDVTQIDLARAAFIDPMGLVLVATLLDRAAAEGRSVSFTGPRDPELAAYLGRMGLSSDAAGVAGRNRPGERFVPLTRFSSQTEADALLSHVVRIFERGVGSVLAAGLDEVTSNVLEHSRRPHGFLALQQYEVKGLPHVAFAVGDSGVGLRTTISTAFPCPTDAAAIELAVTRRVSENGPDRGLGLPSVVAIAAERDGDVRLWSGEAFGVVAAPGRPVRSMAPRGALAGTVVHGRFVIR